MFYGATVSLIS